MYKFKKWINIKDINWKYLSLNDKCMDILDLIK